jgi:hypothetical protein
MEISIVWAMSRKGIAIGDRSFAKEAKVMVTESTNHGITGRSVRVFFADSISTGGTQC